MTTRVLVIDGDLDTLRLIEIKLRRAEFEVYTALDGDRGVVLALAHRPDIVLAESRLPGRDGASVVAEIKRLYAANEPVSIIMSQESRTDDIIQALAHGADDFIAKPFSPRELLVRLQVALARVGQRAELASESVVGTEWDT